MKKNIQYIVPIIVIVVLVTIFVISNYTQNKTYYNSDEVTGNTAGNLYNGGLFCEYDNIVYFSNFDDDGTLYSMNAANCSNIQKLYNDRICYINVDSHYIYYSRINNQKENGASSIFLFYNTGLFRLNKSGNSNLKMLYSDVCGLLSLCGNYVYYQHYDSSTGLYFYRVKIDSKDEKMLSLDSVLPASIYNNQLYYTGESSDHNIKSLDLSTLNENTIYKGNCRYPIVTPDYIYFISRSDNQSIYRIDHDGNNLTLLVDEFCSTYNISSDEKYLYYQVDGGDSNRICMMNLTTMTETTILSGDFKQIHVTSNYVFFRSFAGNITYAYATDGSGTLSTFHPGTAEE